MVSKTDLEMALSEWVKRNGWEVSILPLPRQHGWIRAHVLTIWDKGSVISFRIPLKSIYKVEATDHQVVLYTTSVIYTFTEIGVTVAHQ